MKPYFLFSLLAEFEQTEYTLGWALTLGLMLLGFLVVCVPRPRKRVPKDMLAMEEAKKKQKKKRKGVKKKKKR